MPEIGEDGNTNGDQKPGRVGVEVLVGYSPEPNTTGRVSRGGLDVLCQLARLPAVAPLDFARDASQGRFAVCECRDGGFKGKLSSRFW